VGNLIFGLNGKKLGIIALVLVGVVLAVYVFRVSWNVIGTLAFLGLMLFMHGGHGGHGGHGSSGEADRRDEHAEHAVSGADADGVRNSAADPIARGPASAAGGQTATGAEAKRHSGC
jgi:hypothetical protein